MQITRLRDDHALESLRADWNRLVGRHPFRSWEWADRWWQAYATSRGELFLITATAQDGQLIGLAPWYIERQASGGRVVRFLGSGEVCTDHLDIITAPEHTAEVASRMADWLTTIANDRWDLLDFDFVHEGTDGVLTLIEHLEAAGCTAHRRPTDSLWRLELPDSWDEYMASFSKSRRKRLRKWDSQVRSGDFTFAIANDAQQLEHDFEKLADLHQKRRQSLGEPGVFRSKTFAAFLRASTCALFDRGSSQLTRLDREGHTIGSDLSFLDDETVYLYQSGIDPAALDDSPGHVITVQTIHRALANSQRHIDFLRGDEPYKQDWGATPLRAVKCRVVARHTTAQLRQSFWLVGAKVKDWIKAGVRRSAVSDGPTSST